MLTAKRPAGITDVRLGLLVTEFLSHMSPLYAGNGVFEKELAVNRFNADNPSFYGAVSECKRKIDADPKYVAFLKRTGIFTDADSSTREKVFRSVRVGTSEVTEKPIQKCRVSHNNAVH